MYTLTPNYARNAMDIVCDITKSYVTPNGKWISLMRKLLMWIDLCLIARASKIMNICPTLVRLQLFTLSDSYRPQGKTIINSIDTINVVCPKPWPQSSAHFTLHDSLEIYNLSRVGHEETWGAIKNQRQWTLFTLCIWIVPILEQSSHFIFCWLYFLAAD